MVEAGTEEVWREQGTLGVVPRMEGMRMRGEISSCPLLPTRERGQTGWLPS